MMGKPWTTVGERLPLRRAVERLAEERRSGGAHAGAARTSAPVPLDLAESDEAFVVQAALPGVPPEQIEVTLDGSVLTLRAEAAGEPAAPGLRWRLRERGPGRRERAVTLTAPVDADRAEAHWAYGLVTVTVPKAHPRRIIVGEGAPRATGAVGNGQRAAPPPGAERPAPTAGAREAPAPEDEPDPVTAASMASFPASDAPARTGAHA